MTGASSEIGFFGRHPPKPVLTLRVGIVGHRPGEGRYAHAAEDFVGTRLKEVFAKIDELLEKTWREQVALAEKKANHYDSETPWRVRLVSGLAEGADQWAVDNKRNAWTVDAVLPFPRESYRKDFEKSAEAGLDVTKAFETYLNGPEVNCVEMPAEPAPRRSGTTGEATARHGEDDYARAGQFLLGQIDLLVAVWDGLPKRGRGGTAAMVQAALDAEIPVFWIHSLQDDFVHKIEAIDDYGRVDAPTADGLHSTLEAVVDGIVLLPANSEEGGVDFAVRLCDFLGEEPPRILPTGWLVYDNFKRWHERKSLRGQMTPQTKPQYEAWWSKLNTNLPEAGPLRGRLDEILLPRYGWVDALAVEYSHRYRSTYFICYVLAAVAVLVALLSLVSPERKGDEAKLAFKALLVTIELVTIGGIVWLLREGNARRWHAKWLEYRSLAELLLNVRFLAYLGEHGRAHRLGRIESEASAWFLWYLRATIREVGVPRARFDCAYQWKLLNSVKEQVVRDQRNWHRVNMKALRRMHGCLLRAGNFCFYATAFVLLAFLAAWGLVVSAMLNFGCSTIADLMFFGKGVLEFGKAQQCPGGANWMELGGFLLESREWIVVIAALLPAAGAAFASIRETGDFEKVAEQSSATAAKLFDLHRDLVRGQSRLRFEHTDELLRRTAQALTEDLSAWQSVYGHKRLELPA